MKIIIDVPQNIMTLAKSLLVIQRDDKEFEDTVTEIVEKLEKEPFETDLSVSGKKANEMYLALALLAIGEMLCKKGDKADASSITTLLTKEKAKGCSPY